MLDIIRRRILLKITIPIGIILFSGIFIWSYFHVEYQQRFVREYAVSSADRVSDAVLLGLHYAMMLNSRDEIRAIVENYSRLREIRGIRILNKQGQVMFAGHPGEQGQVVYKQSRMCQVCHGQAVPLQTPTLAERIYADSSRDDYPGAMDPDEHLLRLVSPIPNEQGCSSESACHFHNGDEQILGVLDISLSLSDSESMVKEGRAQTIYLALILFGGIFLALFVLFVVLVKRPVSGIIKDAEVLSRGVRPPRIAVSQMDELGQLAQAIYQMGSDLITKNNQIQLQKNLYQDLFEGVPCLVTVQDRNYRLLSFNRTFGERFSAQVGEHCYKAYKNLNAPCPACPVQKTFKTGQPQCTEESGCYKDGSKAHWIVHTAPIYDAEGKVVAAMEMCLDITERKDLEREVRRSERRYCDIFNNIPSAVFVLDRADLSIIDCNRNATLLYGHHKDDLLRMSFLDLFVIDQRKAFVRNIELGQECGQIKHVTSSGQEIFVSINLSPSEFPARKVYLVTVNDITRRLETEQQLIQASKMATLGEMATGVAHEINQPLAVIQTGIDLVKRSLNRDDLPELPVLRRVSQLIDEQVSRATKIIGHMREFGRKSDTRLDEVDLNAVLRRAFEFFSQQMALRSIEVAWELDERLPRVRCEPNRMEQVFINLFVNARDAIEERVDRGDAANPRRITLKSTHNHEFVTVRVSDTGAGVPEHVLAKIFEPFFTTKQVGKGTGLGLSISYGIVKDYGGSIHALNNETGGATFYVRLPVA